MPLTKPSDVTANEWKNCRERRGLKTTLRKVTGVTLTSNTCPYSIMVNMNPFSFRRPDKLTDREWEDCVGYFLEVRRNFPELEPSLP